MSQHRWRVGAYRQNYGQAPKSSSKPKKASGEQPSTTLDQPAVVKQSSRDAPQPSSNDYTAVRSASCDPPQPQIGGYVKSSPGLDNTPHMTLLVRPGVGIAKRRSSGWQSMPSSTSSRTSSRLSLRYSSGSESDTSVEEWMPTPFSTTQSDILNVLSSRAMTPKAVRICVYLPSSFVSDTDNPCSLRCHQTKCSRGARRLQRCANLHVGLHT